jgi:peptide/nickel transport system ATP-binding protein
MADDLTDWRRTLHRTPELCYEETRTAAFVADEAVSALDVSVQAQVLALLEEVQARMGLAMLFITHDLRVAAQICDDVLVMQDGRVVEAGSAADVLGRPSEAYTRSLIEAAPGRAWDFANFRALAAPQPEDAPA